MDVLKDDDDENIVLEEASGHSSPTKVLPPSKKMKITENANKVPNEVTEIETMSTAEANVDGEDSVSPSRYENLPSVTSSEEKLLLECDDDEKADVYAEVVPSSQKDEENMKESASQEDVKLKTDVPVNFDLISSANDSNDKSGLAKKSVNISQVVSSVIDKLQTDEDANVPANVLPKLSLENSVTQKTDVYSVLKENLSVNPNKSKSSEPEKIFEKSSDSARNKQSQVDNCPSSAPPKVFSHQIKSSFFEKRQKLIEATNKCYQNDPGLLAGINQPTVSVIPNNSPSISANKENLATSKQTPNKTSNIVDSDAETVVMDDESYLDFDDDEVNENWLLDSENDDETLPVLKKKKKNKEPEMGSSNPPNIHEDVDRRLALQMQMELDRDPRAVDYYYSALSKGDDNLDPTPKSATPLQTLPKSIPKITPEKLAPGPKFEHTSLVKSVKFRAAGWCNNERVNDDDDEDVENMDQDDEDVENMDTDEQLPEVKANQRKRCKKGLSSSFSKVTTDQGSQWTKRFANAETRTYPANSTEEEHLLFDQNPTKMPGSSPGLTQIIDLENFSHSTLLMPSESTTPKRPTNRKQALNSLVPRAGVNEADFDPIPPPPSSPQGGRLQNFAEVTPLRDNSARELAIQYNGEYAGDFDEALQAALAASMETAAIENPWAIKPHNQYSQTNDYYPPSTTATATTSTTSTSSSRFVKVDFYSSSNSNSTSGCSILAKGPMSRVKGTVKNAENSSSLFGGSSNQHVKPKSRGLYNLQLHHQQRLNHDDNGVCKKLNGSPSSKALTPFTPSPTSYQSHSMTVENGTKNLSNPFVCFLCRRFFNLEEDSKGSINRQLYEHLQHHTYECLRCFHCGRTSFQNVDELNEHMLENVSVSRIDEAIAAELTFSRRWTLLYLKMIEEGLHVDFISGKKKKTSSFSWCSMCTLVERHRRVTTGSETTTPIVGTVLQTALTSPFSAVSLARNSSLSTASSSTANLTRYEVLDHLCRHIAYWRYVCTLCLDQAADSQGQGSQYQKGPNFDWTSVGPSLALLTTDHLHLLEKDEDGKEYSPTKSTSSKHVNHRAKLDYRRATEKCCFTSVEPVSIMRHMMAAHYRNYGRQAEDAEIVVRWVASGPAEQYVLRTTKDVMASKSQSNLYRYPSSATTSSQLSGGKNQPKPEQERYTKLDLDWMMREANETGWNILVAVATDPSLVPILKSFIVSASSTSSFNEPHQEQTWIRLLREEKQLNLALKKADKKRTGNRQEYDDEDEDEETDDDDEDDEENFHSRTNPDDDGYEAEGEDVHEEGSSAKRARLTEAVNLTTPSSALVIAKTSSILPSPPTSLPEEEAEASRPKSAGKYRLPCFLCKIFFDINQVDVFVRHMESSHLQPKEIVVGRRWAHLFAVTFIKRLKAEKRGKKPALPWFEWCPLCTLVTPPPKREDTPWDPVNGRIRDGLVFMAADHFAQHFAYIRYRCILCDKSNRKPFDIMRDIEAIHGRQNKNPEFLAKNSSRQLYHHNHQNGVDFELLFKSSIPFVNPLTVVDHLQAYHTEAYKMTHAADIIFRREMNITFLERLFMDMYSRTGNHYEPEKYMYIKEETNLFAVKMYRESLLHKFELVTVEEKFEKEFNDENFPITRTPHNLPYMI